jgi:hypothetical protein
MIAGDSTGASHDEVDFSRNRYRRVCRRIHGRLFPGCFCTAESDEFFSSPAPDLATGRISVGSPAPTRSVKHSQQRLARATARGERI